MEYIPQGYKDSPLGVIPQEWEVKRLGEIFDNLLSYSYSRDQMTYEPQEYRYIHYGDIHKNENIDFVDLAKRELPFLLDDVAVQRKHNTLSNGDILLADASEDYEGVGKAIEVIDKCGQKIIAGLHTIALRPKHNSVCAGFGRYIFRSYNGKKSITRIAQGTKVFSISYNLISPLYIPLPPIKEQQRIAEVLGCWDEAIERHTKMVALLETRKRAIMQRLLSPKPHWLTISHSEILKEVNRQLKWDDNELYRLISVKRRSGGLFERESLYGREIKTKNLRPAHEGDFLISKMQIVHGASGLTTREFHDMKISGSYIALVARNTNQLDINYFNWWSKTSLFYHQTYISSFGVHIEKMTFDLDSFMALGMKLPPLEEQKAIVEILSIADSEIDSVRHNLDLLRTQKRALMQQLLTGKKRIKI